MSESPVSSFTKPETLSTSSPRSQVDVLSQQSVKIPVETTPKTASHAHSSDWSRAFRPYWTHLTILGLFLSALLFAMAHYLFFTKLDHFPVEELLQQFHVTYISLLLVLGFRACLMASVAVSSTQYLWKQLRQRTFRLSLIEKLFQIRRQPWLLLDLKLISRSPILYVMAAYLWIAPLATIYPPGALTIASQSYIYTRNLNISVINPDYNEVTNLSSQPSLDLPTLASTVSRTWKNATAPDVDGTDVVDASAVKWTTAYTYPKPSVEGLAKYVMVTGNRVTDLPPTNSSYSYHLKFRAPQLRCNVTFGNSSIIIDDEKSTFACANFDISWSKHGIFTSLSQDATGYYTIPNNQSSKSNTSTTYVLLKTREQKCKTVSMLFDLSISNDENGHRATYTTSDETPFLIDHPGDEGSSFEMYEHNPNDTLEVKVAKAKEKVMKWNILAILESSMFPIELEWKKSCFPSDVSKQPFTFPNGTQVEIGVIATEFYGGSQNYTMPMDSVFNEARFIDSEAQSRPQYGLNLTEAKLNEFLANVTISAHSLNTWFRFVPVNVTESRNIYVFSHPLNLILPYSICLGLGMLCNLLGLWALQTNGEPAEDGGFLQIMTATRGNTDMDRIAREGEVGGAREVSKELLELKVRYGKFGNEGSRVEEVLDDGFRMRCGFGTDEETIALRKTKT